MELVFSAFIGEVRDGFSVRRPDRRSLVHAGGVGQVARIAFFSRNRDDFAAKFENGSRASWRNRSIAYVAIPFYVTRPSSDEVCRNADGQLGAASLFGIENMQAARLLIDDHASPGGS